jgi:TetR/AcrR family transcriptional regulator, regulator of cefoperazone and chloramphenicol sensitivity
MRTGREDLRAEAVIRDTAMRLFAEHGPAAVTIREIAAAAGVSPSLVMHHFGSKEGLRDAVDRRAVAFFEELLGELARIGEEGGSASLAELLAARLEREPGMVDYVRRLLADGGEAADGLFSKLFEATVTGMRALVAAGVARPAADEAARAAFLLANDLSLLMMHRQIARVTGTDPLARHGLVAWSAVVMDVYTGGIFATPPGPGMPPGPQTPPGPETSPGPGSPPGPQTRPGPQTHPSPAAPPGREEGHR